MKQFVLKKEICHYETKDTSLQLLFKFLLVMILYRIIKEGFLPFINGSISFLELGLLILLIFGCILLCYGGYYIGEHFIAKRYKEEECLIDGMLLGLLLPMKTPVFLIILAVFFTIFIGRYFYDGIPIGVPALIGILGVLGFSIWLQICHLENYSINSIILELIGYYPLKTISLSDIWLGNVSVMVSKTSPILCLLSLFYFRKNIKWRIPIYFIGTCLLLFIFSNYFISNSWMDIFKWFGSYNLFFLLIFCVTDRRTTPVTDVGQILFAIFLGIVTFIGSFFFNSFVAMILSTLISNFLTPLYDRFGNYYQLKYCNEYHNLSY